MKINIYKWIGVLGLIVAGHYFEIVELVVHSLCVVHVVDMAICRLSGKACENEHHV